MKFFFPICCVLFFLISISFAKEKEHFQRFSALPILGYSEETALQYGAMALLFFKPDFEGGETKEIDFAFYGSTNNQWQFLIVPYFYFLQDKISGFIDFHYQSWVARYFGRGNHPDFEEYRIFDRETFAFSALIESKLGLPQALNNFKYGLVLDNTYNEIEFRKEDSPLKIPEPANGTRRGIGYHLSYDTRDNINWAKSGFFLQWEQRFYSNLLSDFSFNYEELDLRGYTPLFWKISMAVALLWKRVDGENVPFDMLAGPDGIKRFRGVESQFFRDNQVLILQTELRKKLFWRLAGDIFFEGGKSGRYFSDLMKESWHQAIGFGGQLALNKQEELYARGEISLIDFEKIALTVYIRHAF